MKFKKILNDAFLKSKKLFAENCFQIGMFHSPSKFGFRVYLDEYDGFDAGDLERSETRFSYSYLNAMNIVSALLSDEYFVCISIGYENGFHDVCDLKKLIGLINFCQNLLFIRKSL